MKKNLTTLFFVLCSILMMSANAQDTAQFKPSGKFTGQVFADFQYKAHSPDSANILNYPNGKMQYAATANNGQSNYYTHFSSFEIRRIYLGYEYNFTPKFVGQLLLSHEGDNFDAGSSPSTQAVSGNRTVEWKAANIRWKDAICKGTDIVFGQQATPAYAMLSEQVWAYRSIEKTILDMRGIVGSNDMGIALQGKCKDGQFGYNFMIGNDDKAKPENDNYKRFYGEVYGKFLNKRLIVELYADDKLTQLTYDPNLTVAMNYGDTIKGSTIQKFTKSQMVLKGFVAWNSDPITIGVEVVSLNQKNYAYTRDTASTAATANTANLGDTALRNVMPFGFSIWAHAPIIKEKLGIFARFDSYDPNPQFSKQYTYLKGSVSSYDKYAYSSSTLSVYGASHITETFMTFGLDWTPMPNLHIMPNIWMENYTETALVNDPRTPTTTPSTNPGLKRQSSSYDADYRLTMFWKF